MDMSMKRTFRSFGHFWQELFFIFKNKKMIKTAMRDNDISSAFRERLMLAVTSVNDCRYCSYHHTQLALQEGISAEEAGKLLEGSFEDCPPEETIALLYAQHWAEEDGHPDNEVVHRMTDYYGEQTLIKIKNLHFPDPQTNMANPPVPWIPLDISTDCYSGRSLQSPCRHTQLTTVK